jgi:hypothetical protein
MMALCRSQLDLRILEQTQPGLYRHLALLPNIVCNIEALIPNLR